MSESQQPPAPRRLAPGETPTVEGYYWATCDGERLIILIVTFGRGELRIVHPGHDCDWPLDEDYTDFYGPLTDPREGATLQTLQTPPASTEDSP